MRTIKTNVYTFSELSEDAKENALNSVRGTAIHYEWWGSTYEDAGRVGLRITGFDLDRERHAKGEFTESAYDCANAIIKEHGECCETYKTAKAFLEERKGLEDKLSPEDETNPFNETVSDIEELDEQFLIDLLEDYSVLLQNEYDYMNSDEYITELIKANAYEFTEEGTPI